MNRLLFVHGAAGDARLWEPVIAALPREWHAEAIMLSYFGTGAWPDDGSSFGTSLHARETCNHAQAMGGNVHLICWSYAVHVGLQSLLDRPDLFASALFYEAGLSHYITDAAERDQFERDFRSLFGPVGAALRNEGPEAAVRSLIGQGFAAMSGDRQRIYLDNAGMMPLLMGGGQPPARIGPEELARIATPCRIAVGADTRPAFALPSRALARALPNGDLVEVAGADHFLPESAPDVFAQLVIDWLEVS